MTQTVIQQAVEAAIEQAKTNPDLLISGSFAVNAQGHWISPKAPNAQCFCALGLFYKNLPDDIAPPIDDGSKAWPHLYAILGEPLTDEVYIANDDCGNRIRYDPATHRNHVGLDGLLRLKEIVDALP